MIVKQKLTISPILGVFAVAKISMPNSTGKTWKVNSARVVASKTGDGDFGPSLTCGVSNTPAIEGCTAAEAMFENQYIMLAALSIYGKQDAQDKGATGLITQVTYLDQMVEDVYLLEDFYVNLLLDTETTGLAAVDVCFILDLSEVKTTTTTQEQIQDSLR